MLADHLPGGEFNDPSIQIQNETKNVPKHNIANAFKSLSQKLS
jgi:hypothetical protein